MSPEQQLETLAAGAERLVSPEELLHKLRSKRPLRVKLGFDPSSPDLHLGHLVVLDKVRAFQDLGHKAVIIIGDYTARIGDPTGRSKTRPPLDPDQVNANAKTYTDQVFKVLLPEQTEIRRNGEWFDRFSYADVLRLNAEMTVARLLERDDFRKRYSEGAPITLTEFQYPLMQGHDSVVVHADIELGGSDQLFNNLVGRDLQRAAGQEPQIVMVLPILPGLDGVQKMSKSLGNYVGLAEDASQIFGKTMSISDELMTQWFRILLRRESDPSQHPMETKKSLARTLVARFHGEAAAADAQGAWERQFSQRKAPDEMPELSLGQGKKLWELLRDSGLAASGAEARRLIQQGAVALDGHRLTEENQIIRTAGTLKCGKRKFLRLTP
ncbi:MAG TPA: tyrosine--tRNA ligase [Verrucomicrobiae bacterium]|nr:tyrosine--tRNA ligase [Verrucomicrobiae bacterium]